MSRILKQEMEQDFFYVHDSIVYGAIKKCRISYNHANFDDFVQIGRIKLVDAYREFPKNLFNEDYFYQFTGYAFRKVYWALMDQIRKEQRIFEREEALPESYEEWGMINPEVFDEDFVVWELFYSMLNCLSEKEQHYLKDSVIEQLTVTEIAKKRKVSRKTVYAWRKQVAKKLEHYQDVLKKG